jgi:predicted NUDIX family NTP pyrophosphohydrolase
VAVKASAGVLLYRTRSKLEVFLVHPGGPYWAKKDLGAWTIPKGEFDEGEDPLTAAQREFHEETGCGLSGPFHPLNAIEQPSGKVVHAWAVAGDCDATAITSNMFSMEWPPKSGQQRDFPEIDRAQWFELAEARRRILSGQVGFLEQLESLLGA